MRAVAPTSAKPGDKAILTEGGEWFGWIGGSCAEPAARRAARAALSDGQSRLIHLTNDEVHLARPGVEIAAMSCYSGGSLEIYVEPYRPEPSLVVFGRSPVAEALCRLGSALGYAVTHADLRSEGPAEPGGPDGVRRVRRMEDLADPQAAPTLVVVASHGHYEAEALEWALRRSAAYIGLIASRRRWPDVLARLEQRGLSEAARAVHVPAGLELGAQRPEEVALSVFSQFVAERRGAAPALRCAEPPGSAGRMAARAPGAGGVPAAEEDCCARNTPQALPVDEDCCGAGTLQGAAAEEDCCAASASGGIRFSAVVLAAGLSRRMGAPNKLLLPVGGEPMICRTVRRVLGAGFGEVVVVLGHQAEEVRAVLAPLGVRTVLNPEYASGQVSSVRAGLGALTERSDAVMVCLGDQPLLEVEDLRAAQRAFLTRPRGSILVPEYAGQRGNPVVLDGASAEDTLKRGVNYGCRQFMEEHPERVYRWPAPSERFVRDVDQPSDYQALIVQARP